MDSYPKRASEPELYGQLITLVGTGAAAPTKIYGRGVACTRVSTGLYTLTFTDSPGNLVGVGYGFQATTMSALKGYTVVLGAFDATGKIVQFSVTSSTFALVDLAVLQTLSMELTFKRAGITV